jgi:hypothetical protein
MEYLGGVEGGERVWNESDVNPFLFFDLSFENESSFLDFASGDGEMVGADAEGNLFVGVAHEGRDDALGRSLPVVCVVLCDEFTDLQDASEVLSIDLATLD